MPVSVRTAAVALITDLVLVLVFVLIGRANHDAGPVAGALTTLWPFATGLGAGWLVGRVWRQPLRPVRAGVIVWVATVVVGILLRALSGQGTAFSFVIVATVALGLFLVGWRTVVRAVERVRHRRGADVGGAK